MNPKLNNEYQRPLIIEAQATYYLDMVQIYIPKHPIISKLKAKTRPSAFPDYDDFVYMEEIEVLSERFDQITGIELPLPDKESDLERSLRRSKKRIGDYILCNNFDMFATFTIKDDRQNNEASRRKLIGWLKNQRSRNGKFRYIVVPEFHKDGKSLHFHALLGDYTGEVRQAINPKNNKPLLQNNSFVYEISGYTLGFTNLKIVGADKQDRTKLSAYLKKYITKDMPVFNGKQRYWVSKGLKLPNIENNPEHWYKHVSPDWEIDLDNGKLLRFDLNKHPLTDIFWDEHGHAK